ncbi:hypothetical protein NKH18_10685 [Streptomyces sp. M10(2022)]
MPTSSTGLTRSNGVEQWRRTQGGAAAAVRGAPYGGFPYGGRRDGRLDAAAEAGVIPLAPLSLGDVLNGAFSTIGRYWKQLFGMAAALYGAP